MNKVRLRPSNVCQVSELKRGATAILPGPGVQMVYLKEKTYDC